MRKTRRVFWTCAAVGMATHTFLSRIGGFEAEQKAAKPLTIQFVKRAPRLTKPLEFSKRPQPKRRQVQRKMVAVKARMQAEERTAGSHPTQVLRGLARPGADIGRVLAPQAAGFEPQAAAAAIVGTGEAQQKPGANPTPTEKYHHGLRTGVSVMDGTRARQVAELLSAGDSSYPGVVQCGREYLIGDYSMHEYCRPVESNTSWITPADIYVWRIRIEQ